MTGGEMRLSKSTFIAWQQCPHSAWYRVNDRALFDTFVDPNTKALFAVGNEIDELARQAFPGGLLLGRGQAQETRAAIARRAPVIFQGEFVTDKFVVLCDVLVWNSGANSYDLIEVKSSTSSSRRRDEEYAFDLAFQEHVLKACGVRVGGTYLMRLDSDYVRRGPIDIAQLFARTDFGDAVAHVRQDVPSLIGEVWRWINIKTPPKGPCPCVRLSRRNHCEMFAQWFSRQRPSQGEDRPDPQVARRISPAAGGRNRRRASRRESDRDRCSATVPLLRWHNGCNRNPARTTPRDAPSFS